MAVVRAIPRSSFALILSALIIAAAISFNTLHNARGAEQGSTFYACLFAGSLTQVSTSGPATCGRGILIEWNAQGIPGEQGTKGDTGEQGPAGVDAPKQIAGVVGGDGEILTPGGRGFTPTRVGTGQYRVMFPAGTWSAESFPVPVITPQNFNSTTNITWVVSNFTLELDGSYAFDVRFDNTAGEFVDTTWFFVVTQS